MLSVVSYIITTFSKICSWRQTFVISGTRLLPPTVHYEMRYLANILRSSEHRLFYLQQRPLKPIPKADGITHSLPHRWEKCTSALSRCRHFAFYRSQCDGISACYCVENLVSRVVCLLNNLHKISRLKRSLNFAIFFFFSGYNVYPGSFLIMKTKFWTSHFKQHLNLLRLSREISN